MTKVVPIKKNKQKLWKIEGDDFNRLRAMLAENETRRAKANKEQERIRKELDNYHDSFWKEIHGIINTKTKLNLELDDSCEELGFYLIKAKENNNSLERLLERITDV